MSDQELLELMLTGDGSALAAVMKKYRGIVEYIVARMINTPADREETVMDTFYKVWATRERIDLSKMSLKSYISMSASACTVDKLRKLTSGQQVDPIEDDIEMELDLENEAARSINLGIIKKCVSEMPEPDREIFISRYYYELDVKEISRRTGVKEKKVWNILSRRKSQLRKALIKGGIIL